MSLSALQIGSPLQRVSALPSEPFDLTAGFDKVNGVAASRLKEFRTQPLKQIVFRGQLEIPGSRFVIPEQGFNCTISDTIVTFENLPGNVWPKIRIELKADPLTDNFELEKFQVRASESSADGEILYTRVHWMLSNIGRCSLHLEDLEATFNFKFEPFSKEEEERLLYRAKIFRKLKFIENVFRHKFTLLQEISADQVRAIDFVFRGITEGEFVIRGGGITLPLQSSEIDLSAPGFYGPGLLRHNNTEKIHDLFSYGLEVGPSIVTLKHAELADPKVARQIRQGYQGLILVRFSVLDHLIHIRLENYAARSKKQRQERLKLFKKKWLREDPEDLANLLNEPLMADVSAEEASLIAVGWTQYNNLPDRYCPQEPILVQGANHWCVPIHLVYTSGKGGPVGELVIDRKTGEVISHTPIEELTSKGMTLAKAVQHVD